MNESFLMTNLMEFKNEILKKVRLLENKLLDEFNTKYIQINTDYKKIDNRLNYINENNENLLELVTNQKLNLEKINELENFKNKTEGNITIHDIKIKNMLTEIEKIKSKYDKIIYDNIMVPGYIGQGCRYKTLSEYIQNNILEFSEIKKDKEILKIENIEVKNKLDNLLKYNLNLIDNSIDKLKKYYDTKNKEIQIILNNKEEEFNEKIKEVKNKISKYENQNENNINQNEKNEKNINQIEYLKKDVKNLLMIKNELISLMDKKVEDINSKIGILIKEIELIKKEKDNNINLEVHNMKNNNEEIKTKIFINNNKINNYKLQKNISNNKSKININKVLEQLNNNQNNNDNKPIELKKENKEDNIIKINNISDKNLNNKEIINLKKNKDELENIIKEVDKEIEEKKIMNNIDKYYKNKNIKNTIINEVKKLDDFSSPIITSKKLYDTNCYNINLNKNKEIKDSESSIKNKKRINSTKIKIEGLDKKKIIQSKSLINIKEYKYKNENKIRYIKSNEDENKKYLFKNINLSNIIEQKINNLNKSEKKNIIINNNEEQNHIMKEIKNFYKIRKEKSEKKLKENAVECNIINLDLEKDDNDIYNNNNEEKNIYKINSSKKSLDSKGSKIRNNLDEIGMKINKAFGRTTYNFYKKNELNNNDYNIESEKHQKLTKMKECLNMAFVSSVKRKIMLSDKGTNIP